MYAAERVCAYAGIILIDERNSIGIFTRIRRDKGRQQNILLVAAITGWKTITLESLIPVWVCSGKPLCHYHTVALELLERLFS